MFDNLHAKVKKAAVLKILDKLADQGKLQRKEFGKAKVYLIDQSSFEETSSEQLEKMDKENTELKNQHQDLAKAVNKATEDLQRILKEPTDQEIDSELLSLEKDIQVATNILDSLSSEMGKSALVSEEVFEMEEKKLSELRVIQLFCIIFLLLLNLSSKIENSQEKKAFRTLDFVHRT